MLKQKYTVITQLHEVNNKDIIEYFENASVYFCKLQRKAFHIFKNENIKGNKIDYNSLLKNFMTDYKISRRTANSILKNVQGKIKALAELKKFESSQKEQKIKKLKEEIEKLDTKISEFQEKMKNKIKVNHFKYWNLKKSRTFKKMKLNKFQMRLEQVKWQVETGNYKLCFGTKKLLNSDKEKFILQRDSQMSYIGSKDETSRNQMFQLSYNNRSNQFDIKLRKDFGLDIETKYVFGKCYFNNHKNKLIEALKNKNSTPLTYSIICKNSRYYLHCTFEYRIKNKDLFLTRKNYGTIGVDFNKGFLAISETDRNGNLIKTDVLKYRFGNGNKTKSDLENCISKIVKRSLETGKDVCFEDLNFKDKNSKTMTGKTNKDKKYNNMLHSLAYSLYDKLITNMAFRNKIGLIKVNPAWTSWIAKNKFCDRMKLNIHKGAAFVIARKGLGIKDTI
jgi:transposase, IS605 orfB family protein